MEKKIKTLIKFLIIAVVIIFIAIILIKATYKKPEKPKEQLDLNTIQGIIEYKKGKYIKQEQSKEEGYNLDIYAKLSLDLFDPEDDMRQGFYTNMLVRISKVIEYDNFRVIDEDRKLVIAVKCDKSKRTITEIKINGDKNYWGNIKSQYNIYSLGNENIKDNIDVQSKELLTLIENNWQRNKLNLSEKEVEEGEYETYSKTGIEIRTVNRKVFNIVFTKEYKQNVINGITTQTDFEKIVEILGEPTVGAKDSGIMGYKGRNIYVFFLMNSEISIYRVENNYEDIDEFINMIELFEIDRDVKTFVNTITDIWPDWDIYNYGENFVDLRYTLKGVKIQFGLSQNNGIIYDKSFKGKIRDNITIEDIKNDITKLPKFTYFEDKDNIYEIEFDRLFNKIEKYED